MKNITKNKILILGIVLLLIFVWSFSNKDTKVAKVSDYKNAEYQIDGEMVKLVDGVSVKESAPGSASKITTKYFGNEFFTDLDADGDTDVAFLVTQETGGSGVFFYVVAGLLSGDRYIGSDGYLLGDRIAPQNINLSPNSKHKEVIVVNYADRKDGEPMTAPASEGKSIYLKIDSSGSRWAIVMPDFEGESR